WRVAPGPPGFRRISGVIVGGGRARPALAFVPFVLVGLALRPPLDGIVLPAHLHDLGNLMLAFTMLWAYFSFSQYLIIWAGNLPLEIAWYLHRSHTSWRVIAASLILVHFAVPFILLLSRRVKREADAILKVAAWILVVRLVDLFWQIAPEFHREGLVISWMDVVLPVALGGIWLGAFVRQLRGRAILPVHDPQFDETLGPIIER